MASEHEDINPDIQKAVEPSTEVKNWLVEYVGEKLQPEDNEVTLEMVIEVMDQEFPEFLLPIAEENFIRGYKQAFDDIEQGQQVFEEQNRKSNES